MPAMDPYHPGSKGDARWDRGSLETADGLVIACGPVSPEMYSSIKGIDLVNHFTHAYLQEKKIKETKAAEAQKKADDLRNPFDIPNPLPPSARKQKAQGRRRKQHHRSRHSPFLALPAEIRNRIYSHAIPESRILIQGNHPGREESLEKKAWNPHNEPVVRPPYRLYHLLDNDDMYSRLDINEALLLVCKTVNREVELFMYSRLTFCFESMKVVHKFLNVASETGLKSIKKLELQHAGYAYPERNRYQYLKIKHDRKWHTTCARIARELPALESLRLTVAVHEDPVTLRSGDRWWRSLMALIPNGPLDHVRVSLSHPDIEADRMARASRRIEDRMMSEKGKKIRDERELVETIRRHEELEAAAKAARRERLKQLPPVQAKSSLRIVIKEAAGDKANQVDKPAPKKYFSSKTAGYAREQHCNSLPASGF